MGRWNYPVRRSQHSLKHALHSAVCGLDPQCCLVRSFLFSSPISAVALGSAVFCTQQCCLTHGAFSGCQGGGRSAALVWACYRLTLMCWCDIPTMNNNFQYVYGEVLQNTTYNRLPEIARQCQKSGTVLMGLGRLGGSAKVY